jgi:ADP-heptose:LPS heptosyltransferase
MSTAFVHAVRELYPGAVIDVIVKKELSSVASMIQGVSGVYEFSKQQFPGLGGAFRFGKSLSKARYDIFFNLPESLSSQVIAWGSSAHARVGFAKEGSFLLLTRSFKKPTRLHRVDEYVSLLERYAGKKIDLKVVSIDVEKPTVNAKKRLLINFNSEASSRRMPLEKAISIVKVCQKAFKGVEVTFIGSGKETPFVRSIMEGANTGTSLTDLSGKTSLKELARVMAESTAILTTDSGPAHLANAVGTPTVVLFGAGDEHNTAPYNKHDLSVLRYGKLECEPCVRNSCRLYGIPKCMEMIDEMSITEALAPYLVER